MAFIISGLIFVIFAANVYIGARFSAPFMGDVAEMVALLVASIFFVAAILQRETARALLQAEKFPELESGTNTLKAIDKNGEKWLLLVFYVALVGTMFVEVIRRELLSYSSIWGEEIVRYAFIYLAWIGAAAAVKERSHIRIDVILHYVPSRMKALVYIFGDLVMLGVALIALYWSLEAVHVAWKFGSVTHGLRISQVFFLAAIPIGFALVTLRLIQSLLRDMRNLRLGKPVFEGNPLFEG